MILDDTITFYGCRANKPPLSNHGLNGINSQVLVLTRPGISDQTYCTAVPIKFQGNKYDLKLPIMLVY